MSAATQNEMDRLRRERDDAFAKGRQVFDDLRRVEAERNALTAHVERMTDALEDVTQAAQHEGLQFTGWKDQIDSAAAAMLEAPTTSLARLKAEWQAEALENCENISETYFIPELGRETQVVLLDDILKVADLLRRQAEEPSND